MPKPVSANAFNPVKPIAETAAATIAIRLLIMMLHRNVAFMINHLDSVWQGYFYRINCYG